MLDIFGSIWDLITGFVSFVVDLFQSIVTLFILLVQCLNYISSIFYIVPGEFLIFGIAFMLIFVFNRLTFGSNGGDSK